MKKKIFLHALVLLMVFLCASVAFADVAINETNFPDEVFRRYVSEKIDGGSDYIYYADGTSYYVNGVKDGVLTDEEMAIVYGMNADDTGYDEKISSLKGIEYFPNLGTLYCGGTATMEELDVSKNLNLQLLQCWGTSIKSLDLSKNTELTSVMLRVNKLTELDVSANQKLETLDCGDNLLTKLDVSGNSGLKTLYCDMNQLTSLKLNDNLEELNCSNNKLTELNVGGNIKYLECRVNLFTALDLRGHAKLQSLNCEDNTLTELLIDSEALTTLNCVANKLTELNLSNLKNLETLDCSSNQLESLDVGGDVALKELICPYNKLTSLDISASTKLERFNCEGSRLTELDLSNNTSLTYLNCYGNWLRSLNVSNTKITDLFCANNQLTALDLSEVYAAAGWLRLGNQVASISASNIYATGDYDSPYAMKLSALSIDVDDAERISYLSATGSLETIYAVVSGDIVKFSSKPQSMNYGYDTRRTYTDEAGRIMDVAVYFVSDTDEPDDPAPETPDTPTTPDNPNEPETPENGGGSGTSTKAKSESPSSTAQESIKKPEVVEKVVSEIAKLFSNLPDSVKSEIKTLSNTYTGTSKTFTSSELSKIISDDEKNPVVLETMTVASNGIYTFKIPGNYLTAGTKIFIHMLVPDSATVGAVKVAEKETESAVFINDNGDVIDTVPASKDVNVTAYMQANTEYTPVVTQAADKETTAGSSGVGCEAGGLGIFGLLLLSALKRKK